MNQGCVRQRRAIVALLWQNRCCAAESKGLHNKPPQTAVYWREPGGDESHEKQRLPARPARRRTQFAASADPLLGSRCLIGWVGLPFPEQDGSNPQICPGGQQSQVWLQVEEPYRLRSHHHGDRCKQR